MAPNAGEAVGAVLNGQYKLLRLVGEGGLAAVYEAEGLQGQGRRAIKLLHPQFVTQRAIVERFYNEAKACFALRHPHIASVEAYAYAEDGSPYLVMELLKGMSLETFLMKDTPMTPEQASPICYGILQALEAAHAQNIVHRDLKPANLFLVPEGQGTYAVKVLDFGIAKVMDLAGGMGSKTRTGAVLGTPGYMSPEQIKNAKAVDARTDLWAAGVVFYEMLTCKHPFGMADQLARMVAVLRDPPTPISQVAPHLASWDGFFQRALARDPDQRFQTTQEMSAALRTAAHGAAHFTQSGLQTVAIPMMPNLMAQLAPASPSPASPHSAAPGGAQPAPHTSASPQAAARGATTMMAASEMPIVAQASQHAGQPSMPQPSAALPAHAAAGHPSMAQPAPHPSVGHPSVAQPAAAQPPHAHGHQLHAGAPQAQAHAPHVTPAPPAGQRTGSSTQVSEGRPAGTPTMHSDIPPVNVVHARDEEPPSLVWWGVGLVGVSCFGLGILVGYLLAY